MRRGIYSARRSGRCDRRLRHGDSTGKIAVVCVAVDEVVYVLQGAAWRASGPANARKKIFEWQSHAMFLIPATTIAS